MMKFVKNILLPTILVIIVIVANLLVYNTMKGKITELERNIAIGLSTQAGASFYPASGGMDSTAASGELQDITTTADKDVGWVAVSDYTGTTSEGFINGLTNLNFNLAYCLDVDGGSGEDWPDYGVSGDGGSERWKACGDLRTWDEFIPVEWMIGGASPPGTVLTYTSGTNKAEARKFDPTSDEDLVFLWMVPKELIGTSIKFRAILVVTEATGPSSETIEFELQGCSVGDNDPLNCTEGTAVASNVTSYTAIQYDIVTTNWSSAITVTNLLAGEIAHFKLIRDASDDTYEQDIGLIAIEIRYPGIEKVTW